MQDEDLRELFSEWARPLRAAVPPAVSVIRGRARRRTGRVAAACVTAMAVLAAGGIAATDELGGRQAPVASRQGLPALPLLGQLPAPDAGAGAAPYYVAVSADGGSADVWDAATGRQLATIAAPTEPSGHGGRSSTIFTNIAAAGDDRTFVLAAIANTNSEKALPVWLFEVRLTPGGSPGPLQPLSFPRQRQGTVGHWYQGIESIALTADGTRLAIATNRVSADHNGPADIEVISLATGSTRTWTSTPQDISSLSWAGDSTLAYQCGGVCLLNTDAPGHELAQSRLLIPGSTSYRGMESLQWPMITPDGSAVYAAMEGAPGFLGLVEFSARTGRPLRVVIQPQNTVGAFCGTLWSDPSGQHLTAACTWDVRTGTIDNGRFTPGRNLAPQTPGTDDGAGDLIAWLCLRIHALALSSGVPGRNRTPVGSSQEVSVSRHIGAQNGKRAPEMPRNQFGFLVITSVTAALLTATAACSTGGASPGRAGEAAVRTRAPAATAAAAKPAKRIDVLSASFVSPSTGWLLAELPCAYQVNPCRSTVLMRETVNGGRAWFAVPAPPAPPADMFGSSPPPDGVGRVLFTSARDGWAIGPSLWRTTDGGATWRRVSVPGPVSDFTLAAGRMLAVIGGCDSAGNCAYRGYTAPVGEDAWRPVPGTAITGTGDSSVQLAVSGSAGYLLAIAGGLGKPLLLAGPVTGSARWRPMPEPCAGGDSGAVAAAAGWLFLGCGSEPGAGNQPKTAYVSHNGGRTWHRVASPPFGGYLGGATMSPGGTVFLSGERMDVYISPDRGGSWHVSPTLAPPAGMADAGLPMLATTVTDTFGVVVQQGGYTQQVWLTRDGGSHWTPATVH